MKKIAVALLLLSLTGRADWLIVQKEVRTLNKKASNTVITNYIDGNHFRKDMEPEGKKEGLNFRMFYKGGETFFFCRPTGKNQGSCNKLNISELFLPGQSLVSQIGAKLEFQRMTLTPAGGPKTVAGKTCQPYKMDASAQISLLGKSDLTMKGMTCFGDFAKFAAPNLDKQLAQVSTPEALKGFQLMRTLGMELEKEVDISFHHPLVGGKMDSHESLKLVSIVQKSLPASTFELPAGYTVTEGAPGLPDLSKLLDMAKQKK